MISQEHPSGRVFAQVCVDIKRTMITESTVVSQCNVDDYFVDDPSILTPPISNHASEEFCSHLNENLPLSPSSTTKVVDNEESIQEPLSPISTKDAVLMITVINETDRFDENDEKETILSTPSSDADCDPSKENTTIECDSYRCSPSPSLPLTPLAGDDDICDEQQEASLICQVESGSPSCPSSPRRFLVKSHRHHPYNGRSGHHQRRTPPSVSCDSTNRTVLTKHYTMHLDYSSRIPSPLHIDTILANAQSSTNRAEAHKHKVRLAKQIQSVILADDFAQLVKLLNSQTDKPDLNVFINGQTALHYCLLLGRNVSWCKQLVSCGANPNLSNQDGWHPLHLAAFKGLKETLNYLVHCNNPHHRSASVSYHRPSLSNSHHQASQSSETSDHDRTSVDPVKLSTS